MTPLVDRIRALTLEERDELFAALPPGALAAACEHFDFWGNERQAAALPAPGDLAPFELFTGGFGAGKTWLAVRLWTREYLAGRVRHGALVSATMPALAAILIGGDSGIWTWLPYEWRARCGHDVNSAFVRSRYGGTFQLPGLPPVECLAVQTPGRATGHGKDLVLWDDPAMCVDVCGEGRARQMFTNLRRSRRAGANPSIIIPTTTNGVAFLHRALSGHLAGVRRHNLGGARDNTANPPSYVADLAELAVEGEDLGEHDQTDTPGALWKRRWITAHYVPAAPDLARVVVAVDPADDAKASSDETGIAVVGLGHDGRLYVLADLTGRHRTEHWPAIAAWAFRVFQADAIVAEANRAAGLVRRCMAIEAPHVPLVEVMAARGKDTRAEPLSLLYRDGQVSHVAEGPQLSRPGLNRAGYHWIEVSVFDPATGKREIVEVEVRRDPKRWVTLEDELCGWVPRQSRSPNGLDALVWACWHLRPPDGEGASDEPRIHAVATSRYASVMATRGYGRLGR